MDDQPRHSRRAAGRRRWRRLRWRRLGDATRLGVCHARIALAGAVAVIRALAGGEERFPGDAGGIIQPRLFGLRVTAAGLSLLDDGAAGLMQARVDFVQLGAVLHLDSEVIEAGLSAARR